MHAGDLIHVRISCRYFLAVGVLRNKLYIVGGVDKRNTSLKTAECYDSEKGTWTQVASMSQPRCAYVQEYILVC